MSKVRIVNKMLNTIVKFCDSKEQAKEWLDKNAQNESFNKGGFEVKEKEKEKLLFSYNTI